MAFDISRKISYYERIRIRLHDSVGNVLEELSRNEAFAGKKNAGFVAFRKNIEILEQYSRQQKQGADPGAAAVTAEKANRAWKEVQAHLSTTTAALEKQLAALPKAVPGQKNDPGRAAMTDYLSVMLECRACFELAQKHENEVQRMGRTELFEQQPENGLSIRDAQPYLEVLAGSGVLETLGSLAERPTVSAAYGASLRTFGEALRTLTTAVRAGNADGAELTQAWDTMKKGAPELLGSLTRRLERMDAGDAAYEDLMRLRTAVTACQEAVERAEARERVRSFRLRSQKIDDDIAAVNRELADAAVLGEVLDEDEEIPEEEEYTPAELEMRMHFDDLRNYRWNIGIQGAPFEEEFPKLNRQIEQYRRDLPEELRVRYDKGVSFQDLKEYDERYRTEFTKAHRASVEATRNLNRALDQALGSSGLSTEQRVTVRNALSRAVTDASARKTAERDNGQAALSKTLDALQRKGIAIPEACAAELKSCFDRQVPGFSRAMNEMNRAMGNLNGIHLLWELKVVEGKRAILVEQNRALYEKERDAKLAELQNQPDAKLRQRLKKLGNALGKAHKLGINSEEYTRFRSALNAAAESGSLETLYQAARTYIQSKDSAPTTASGRARLTIATQVAALLQTSLEHQKHPVIPEAEKNAPLVEVAFDPFEQAEPEIVSSISVAAEQEAQPAPQVVPPAQQAAQDEIELFEQEEDPVYLSAGYEATDAFHETTAFYIETHLFSNFGWDEELCRKVADKMVQIMDRNLTGKSAEDEERMIQEYRKTFVDPGLEGYPRIPRGGTEEDVFLISMRHFAREYQNGLSKAADRDHIDPSSVDLDDYPNSTLEPGKGRDDMRLKMAAQVERKLRREAPFDREFQEDVMGIMLDKNTPDTVRNLLVNVNLNGLLRADLRGETLKNKLYQAVKVVTPEMREQKRQKIAAVQEFRKNTVAARSAK